MQKQGQPVCIQKIRIGIIIFEVVQLKAGSGQRNAVEQEYQPQKSIRLRFSFLAHQQQQKKKDLKNSDD